MTSILKIENLQVEREGQIVVNGVSLEVKSGELVALLGPNGSGKSSLVSAVMGHPKFVVSAGDVKIGDTSVLPLGPDERAKLGLFLSVQQPPEVPGLTVASFLRAAFAAVSPETLGMADFRLRLVEKLGVLGLDQSFLSRGLNEGFSGGERKRLEMLQLAVLEPKFAMLDETDSGLDVDAWRVIEDGVKQALARGAGVLLISHNPEILRRLKPQRVLVLCQGQVVADGDSTIADKIGTDGYMSVCRQRE